MLGMTYNTNAWLLGAKTHMLTAYALSAEPVITTTASSTTMDVLLAGIKSTTLGTSTLTVTYTRP
jgi:hypothetical protein